MPIIFKQLGIQPYLAILNAMQAFTQNRDTNTLDEIWLLQHPAIFTQGQAGKAEHILDKGEIPVIQSDRGGQVTYHAPGQLIAYLLFDLKRMQLNIRDFVTYIEDTVIELLAKLNIQGHASKSAPGVYVDGKKICSLGIRVKKGCTYHGLSLNVDLDLTPFSRINPCGYKGLAVTKINDLQPTIQLAEVEKLLQACLLQKFSFT